MIEKNKFLDKMNIKLKLLIYNYEYQILILASILSGLLIVHLSNKYFLHTELYYAVFFFGFFVSFLGFVLEYVLKHFKKKAIETSFTFFLQDLSREYKSTNNLSISLNNITTSNVYGSIDTEIKRIANRVSWGDDFENALSGINETIKSPIITHTLILLKTFKESSIPLDRVLLNISKDISIFKEETQKKKYFLNLYYLSIVLFVIFLVVILFINIILGNNFLWYADQDLITRIFFDNFLLYMAIVLSIFISFIMFAIKEESSFNFIKYIFIFFIFTILIFQIAVPKPDAESVLIDTITYMNRNQLEQVNISEVIALKSISSKYILDKTYSNNLYFLPFDQSECGLSCAEYAIFVPDAVFFDFEIRKSDIDFVILYRVSLKKKV
ncbi:type II secretion system F family protein [archaeon]|nr:type II secretion system F family protein [archaeon]NCP79192.1 type II secretion system F family protein [archaeon]NCP97861.1 type II secretion system F family protein [archaeon]NCQ06959.1 type II secretion system F family protein [archaeon]NCQ50755.1 type II secretion system F family protein [archaeon]